MGGFWWCIQGFLWSLCPVVLGGLHNPCSSELCVINSSASHSYLKTIPTLHLLFPPPLSLIFSDPYLSPQQNYTRSEFSPYFPKPCHFTPQCWIGLGDLLFSRQQALCKLMSITGHKGNHQLVPFSSRPPPYPLPLDSKSTSWEGKKEKKQPTKGGTTSRQAKQWFLCSACTVDV